MASFYYYDQNPFRFSFPFVKFGNLCEVYIKKALICKRKKILKDSGDGSKMTSSCKRPVAVLCLKSGILSDFEGFLSGGNGETTG